MMSTESESIRRGGSAVDGGEDVFDRLPDEVVLSIFEKLQDARSLCLSMSVCKRFRSIAPLVGEIFLPVPHQKKSAMKESDQQAPRGFFRNLVIKALMKPYNFISQIVRKSKSDDSNDLDFYSYYVPNEILKSFEEIRGLHLRLPCHGNQKQGSKKSVKNPATFLKWKAEFGGELHSCVILGAKSWTEKPPKEADSNSIDSDQESRFMADDELKIRIVWTISCLIAASARHYLIQETVKTQKRIENVVVSDETDQGRLCMNKEQIEETRELKGNRSGEVSEYRSRVPALRMKMWYLERLELSGKVMEGATLVVIRPAAAGGGEAEKVKKVMMSDGDMVAGAFGGEEGEGKVLDEAVRKLMVAKKCYTLEMNSF